jgi:mannose-6-phosphate isomerase-like protein (cupin superfamily)
MQKINLNDIRPEMDGCGEIRHLYSSPHLSLSHVKVVGPAKAHYHKMLEEIYYVTQGSGELVLGDKVLKIREGDVIPIPKNTVHQLRPVNNQPFEIIFVTYPAFTMKDVYPANP